MKTEIYQGNYSEIEFPLQALEDICQTGENGSEVTKWTSKLKLPPVEVMFKEISEYDDYDGLDDEHIGQSYVWITAWNLHDDLFNAS